MKRAIGLLALLMATPAYAGEDVHTSWTRKQNSQWTLSEHRGKVTGVFKFCSIQTFYIAKNTAQKRRIRTDEMSMMLMYGGYDTMSFSIAGSDWKTTPGREYTIRFIFPDGDAYRISADGISAGGMVAIFKPDADWIKRMMLESAVQLEIEGKNLGAMRLDGSADAIRALTKCALDGRAEAGGETFYGGTAKTGETF